MRNKLLLITLSLFSGVTAGNYLDLDGSSSHVKGPNCWNGALFAAGVVRHKRFMHPDEWLYLLNKNCSEISSSEPGAVGRLYVQGGDEVHGFIHLDDETIFAKHGEDQAHGYKVMSYESMLKQYGRTRQCRSSNQTEPKCYHKLKYYRCSGQQEFDPNILKINESMETLSFSPETRLKFKDNCLSESFLARERELNKVKELLLNLKDAQVRNSSLEAVLLPSLSHQLHNLEVSNRNFRCKNRKEKYRAVKEVRNLIKTIFTGE